MPYCTHCKQHRYTMPRGRTKCYTCRGRERRDKAKREEKLRRKHQLSQIERELRRVVSPTALAKIADETLRRAGWTPEQLVQAMAETLTDDEASSTARHRTYRTLLHLYSTAARAETTTDTPTEPPADTLRRLHAQHALCPAIRQLVEANELTANDLLDAVDPPPTDTSTT